MDHSSSRTNNHQSTATDAPPPQNLQIVGSSFTHAKTPSTKDGSLLPNQQITFTSDLADRRLLEEDEAAQEPKGSKSLGKRKLVEYSGSDDDQEPDFRSAQGLHNVGEGSKKPGKRRRIANTEALDEDNELKEHEIREEEAQVIVPNLDQILEIPTDPFAPLDLYQENNDDGSPKQPLKANILFFRKYRPIVEEHFTDLPQREVQKKEQKQPFIDKAEELRQEYKVKVAKWKQDNQDQGPRTLRGRR
ncbi:hypothetical protein BDQ17DRAFT_1371546 [Cyathus striatus]|nr:hypothetical protein BDQ17DRAFT_1371546 [Cyathus striatus]